MTTRQTKQTRADVIFNAILAKNQLARHGKITLDVSELYHIITSRGFSSTRTKLQNVLEALDNDLYKRTIEQDFAALQGHQ